MRNTCSLLLLASSAIVVLSATNATGDPDDRTLDAAAIAKVTGPAISEIRACYEAHAPRRRAGLALRIELTITPEGSVRSHANGLTGKAWSSFSACVDSIVEAWSFLSRRGFTSAIVPFVLQKTDAHGAGPAAGCRLKRGCPTPVPTSPPEGDLKAEMRHHFKEVTAVQAALIQGDLAEAKRVAGELALMHVSEGWGWERYAFRVRERAQKLARLATADRAYGLVTDMATQCARCHVDSGAVAGFAWSPEIADDGTVPTRMARHQWAAERLWHGLVGPSTERWNEGVRVLAEQPQPAEAMAKDPRARERVGALSFELVARAKQAAKTTGQGARARVFAGMLEVCAACHTSTR
jgi:hypothetical protein